MILEYIGAIEGMKPRKDFRDPGASLVDVVFHFLLASRLVPVHVCVSALQAGTCTDCRDRDFPCQNLLIFSGSSGRCGCMVTCTRSNKHLAMSLLADFSPSKSSFKSVR